MNNTIKRITIITLSAVGLISLLIFATSNDTLNDISSNLFFGGYIISVLSAACIGGALIAPNVYAKSKQEEYDKKVKELKQIENDNKVDIKFSAQSVALYEELQTIEEKIKLLNKDK
ncbi:MAG: hypothetical protein U9Q40_02645 [Campylobacterota bacterium]|nr:hypothetical protein [Campylobacterota bacterium]